MGTPFVVVCERRSKGVTYVDVETEFIVKWDIGLEVENGFGL